MPATVTIPMGSTSVPFSITAVNDTLLDGSQTTQITASAPNISTKSQMLTVHDNETATLTLTLPAFIFTLIAYVVLTLTQPAFIAGATGSALVLPGACMLCISIVTTFLLKRNTHLHSLSDREITSRYGFITSDQYDCVHDDRYLEYLALDEDIQAWNGAARMLNRFLTRMECENLPGTFIEYSLTDLKEAMADEQMMIDRVNDSLWPEPHWESRRESQLRACRI